jgi:type I restriction enzyme S subunit
MKWELKSFDEIGFIGRGKSRHRPRNAEHLYGGEYPFIQTGDIKAANFRISEFTQTYNEVGLAQSKLWKPGTLCITIAANIADTAILDIEACFPDSVIGFVPYEEKSDVRFVKYFFDLYQVKMKSISTGAAQDNLSLEKLLTFKIPTPPLPTQRRIAGILSAYDDLIENNLKRIKLLEEKAFLRYKLLLKKDKIKLHEIYDTSSGGTPSRSNSDYFTGDINWFKSKELTDTILLESEEKITEQAVEKSSAKIFPAGSVIMAMYGATIGKLGLLSQPSATNQACCAIIEKDELRSNFYILNWLMENREYILSFRMGAAQENISQQVIRNLFVTIPSISELKLFNQEVKSIYCQIKNLQEINTKLREARDILLPRLMSGQIEV